MNKFGNLDAGIAAHSFNKLDIIRISAYEQCDPYFKNKNYYEQMTIDEAHAALEQGRCIEKARWRHNDLKRNALFFVHEIELK